MVEPPPQPALIHRTVLAAPAVAALLANARGKDGDGTTVVGTSLDGTEVDGTEVDGTYVDGTFGRGGHSRLVLQKLGAAGRLIACDRDPAAAQAAAAITDPRFHFARTRFSQLGATLASHGVDAGGLNGLLLDLGVSSPQIDDPSRGFSWRNDAPLDMRMDPDQGASAAQWLAQASFDELTRVIRDHGEERFASSIAKAIVARRTAAGAAGAGGLGTTGEFAALVASAIPVRNRKDSAQHPATRTFQAVRIHLNQELEELALTLDLALSWLAPGGRLVVISFHSLEDRIVKRFIDAHAHPERAFAHLPLTNDQMPPPRLQSIARTGADEAEVAMNPRARSAIMRVAQRTDALWVPPPAATAQSSRRRSAPRKGR